MTTPATASVAVSATTPPAQRRRALLTACAVHAIHDGMTDAIYVLLPLWQSQFAISYALTGLLRAMYAGCMAGFQLQASALSQRWGRKGMLVGGTALAGLAYLLAGLSPTLPWLAMALALAGVGASVQHPLASALVADTHDHDKHSARAALASYNFAGDLGKMAIPALVGVALTWWSWQHSAAAVGWLGLAAAAALAWTLPAPGKPAAQEHATQAPAARPANGHADGPCAVTTDTAASALTTAVATAPTSATIDPTGAAAAHAAAPGDASGTASIQFRALLATGVIDSATRMGFLTFLPFLLKAKGAGNGTIGLALSLLFVGGAFGKLACGHLGQRLGLVKTVWLTEGLTALAIVAILGLPLSMAMAALPLLGVALNGTSSVLYGTVPELVPPGARNRAFALFYTGTIGGSAIAPIAFGWLGDRVGIPLAMQAVAAFVCLTLPLVWLSNRTS